MPRAPRANPWLNTTRPEPISLAWRQRLGLDAALPMPWEGTPLPREPRPPREPWYRGLPAYVSPRERSLHGRTPGPESVTDEEMKAYVAVEPFVRGGLKPATVRALCYISRFAKETC
jgi:hypothetical protein